MTIDLRFGDCLEVMKNIENGSIDMVLVDPPYGITSSKWDSVIPLEPMWEALKRIVKDNGAIAIMGSQPFTSELIHSNLKMFKYCWYWNKKIPSGMAIARFQPMRQIEEVVIFCKNKEVYNPQMVKRDKPIVSGGQKKLNSGSTNLDKYKKEGFKKTYHYKNPINLIEFMKMRKGSVHPTQKPVELMEYLIKTYTDEKDIVLDFAIGSGTTGVACQNLNRNFIGIENDEKYFNIAKDRLKVV